MALTSYVVRGNSVEFAVTFTDADGIDINPVSAVVTINYLSGGIRVNETIDLAQNTDGAWAGVWESVAAEPGRVYWSAWSFDPTASQDGTFDIKANLANLNINESA